jgi:dephospho-CoA kinase
MAHGRKIAVTGGIACGKSAVTDFLRRRGVAVVDADEIVHELIPVEERRRLAKKVFSDSAARRELESRIHPVVKRRIRRFFDENADGVAVAAVPLLFEAGWDGEYDAVCTVVSSEENQIARMMSCRGYSREEAESRMAAQMPVAEKAARSHYVIVNDGSTAELEREAEKFLDWLRSSL